MGQVDVLFMTAGGVATEEIKSFLDIEPDVWRTVVERNLTSVYLCSRVFGRHMVERGSGSIIATASQLGTVGHAGLAHYCSSKGGIIQLVKVMAVDLAATGVRVNAIAPGPTATPAVRAALDEMGEAYRKEMTANIPLGRFGEPEDMAGAVVFLASDDAAFITGSTVMVDGGYTIV
jgi:NAD(P)-dependent dehydrogenase (short-subunit alcohol dehydrogenase family)